MCKCWSWVALNGELHCLRTVTASHTWFFFLHVLEDVSFQTAQYMWKMFVFTRIPPLSSAELALSSVWEQNYWTEALLFSFRHFYIAYRGVVVAHLCICYRRVKSLHASALRLGWRVEVYCCEFWFCYTTVSRCLCTNGVMWNWGIFYCIEKKTAAWLVISLHWWGCSKVEM